MERGARAFGSAVFLALAIVATMLASAGAAPTTVSVDGQQPWTATGISVQAGQVVAITATGRINYCSGAPQCDATPDGSVSGESHCGTPGSPTGSCGALIGRIGGSSFVVGSNFKMKATTSGALELGIQDF